MRFLSIVSLISALSLLTGCASLKPEAFADGQAAFEPEKFFVGTTHSSGVFENRRGQPVRRITTETKGTLKEGMLYIEQDLMPEGKKATHRSWKLRRVDAHHVDATANDIIGTAHGALYGNMMCWHFTLALSPGHPIRNVRMSQFMYLQPDGRTLIIRTIIRKAGFIVTQVTEAFRKE
jgi:hypothetical protein